MPTQIVEHATIWDAIGATTTTELQKTEGLPDVIYARAILLDINGSATPNWALDIQGKATIGATYHNIDYFRVDQGTAYSLSAAQLTVNWTTSQHYVIPNPPPFVQLKGVRTGGNITVHAAFSSEPYPALSTATTLADDAAFTPGTSTVVPIGALADESAPDSVDEGDIGVVRMTLDRFMRVLNVEETNEIRDSGVARTPAFATVAASSSGDNTIVTATASRKIRVLSYVLVASGTVNAKWQSATAGDLTGLSYLVANTGVSAAYNPKGHFEAAVNEDLQLNLSGAVPVGGHITYVKVLG